MLLPALLLVACDPASTGPTLVEPPAADSTEVLPDVPQDSAEDTAEDTAGDTAQAWPEMPLAVIRIDADGPIASDVETTGTMEVIEIHDGSHTDLADAPRSWSGPVGIELHGSSSTGYPKIGMRVECRDETGADADCPLVGLPAESDWVLNAPYSDKSYVRNALMYGVARELWVERGAWAPRTRYVEVYVDDDYRGLYLLVERVKIAGRRLDIPDYDEGGGFLVKIDQHRGDGFDTTYGTPVDWVDPRPEDLTSEAAATILDWFDQLEVVLAGPDFADPSSGYPAWIDVDEWVDVWLLNEWSLNIDAYRLSTYHWTAGPPGQSLLHAGPVWDYDRAFGDVNYCDCWLTRGWVYEALDDCGYAYQYPFWWERLREDPAWNARLVARWAELRAGPLADAEVAARIDALRVEIAEAEARDQQRWGTMGTWVDPNWYVGATWEEELGWLQEWLAQRSAWMDGHVGDTP